MDLHETPVAPLHTRNLLIRLLVCVVALGVLAVVVALVLRSLVAPVVAAQHTPFGDCPVTGRPCTDVPRSTIERVSGVTLPAEAQVLKSEATTQRVLNERLYLTAWVRIPVTSLTALRTGTGAGDPDWDTPRDGIGNIFADFHSHVRSFDDHYGTTLALGEGSERSRLLYIHTTLPEAQPTD